MKTAVTKKLRANQIWRRLPITLTMQHPLPTKFGTISPAAAVTRYSALQTKSHGVKPQR
jgi:hypothetical protein